MISKRMSFEKENNISYFPSLYPDELMYSLIIRYMLRYGLLSFSSVSNELFGKKSRLSIYYTSNFDYLCSQFPENLKITPNYFIYNHTIMPFFLPFLTYKNKCKLLNNLTGNKSSIIHNTVGYISGGIKNTRSFKYCPKCIEYDDKIHGEPYIHRNHQFPGFDICSAHRTYLNEYTFSDDICNCSAILLNELDMNMRNETIEFMDFYININEDIEILVSDSFQEYDLEKVRKKYLSMLMRKGFLRAKGSVNQRKLHKEFLNYYPSNLLDDLNCNVEYSNRENWIRKIVMKESLVGNPLKHLLFIRFLFGSLQQFLDYNEDYDYFGGGPWPCLNPVATHYKENIIDEYTINKGGHKGKLFGCFKCICGFEYSRTGPDKEYDDRYKIGRIINMGHEWEQVLCNYILKGTYSIRKLAKLMGCDRNTIIRYAQKLGIAHHLNTKQDRYFPNNNVNGINETLRSVYREDIMTLVKQNPCYSRKDIYNKLMKQYSWLYIYDYEFLLSILPKPKGRYMVQNKNYEDLWNKKDMEINEKVKNVIREILAAKIPLKITRHIIKRKIKYTLIYTHIDKLPLTKETIEQAIESDYEFKIRQIKQVVKEIIGEGESLDKQNILKRLGVKKSYSVEIIQYIENLCDENIDFIL